MNHFTVAQKIDPPVSINQSDNPSKGCNGSYEIRIILIQITLYLNGVKSVFFVEKSSTFPFVVHKSMVQSRAPGVREILMQGTV